MNNNETSSKVIVIFTDKNRVQAPHDSNNYLKLK